MYQKLAKSRFIKLNKLQDSKLLTNIQYEKISKKTLEEIAGWTSLRRVWCVMREDLE